MMMYEERVKVVYNRNSKMFNCIYTQNCDGRQDRILFATDSDCSGSQLSDLQQYLFDGLIEEIKRNLHIEAEHPDFRRSYVSDFVTAEYVFGKNGYESISVKNFSGYGFGKRQCVDYKGRLSCTRYGTPLAKDYSNKTAELM